MFSTGNWFILQIVDNHSSHGFHLGEYVIAANAYKGSGVESNKDYCYAYSARPGMMGQYLTAQCANIITKPLSTKAIVSPSEVQKKLKAWLKEQKVTETYYPRPLLTALTRTQKARGLQVLIAANLCSQPALVTSSLFPGKFTGFPYFARPCPLTPRHGFVDSRVVKNTIELNIVIEEAKQADPLSEVLLMDPIKAAYSAVITDSAVTMGKGTDGATSGKSSIVIPCVSNIRNTVSLSARHMHRNTKTGKRVKVNALKYAGIKPDMGVFIESVGEDLVQLRTGPQTDFAATRYSTESILIPKEIYTPYTCMDFLEYEAYLDKKLNWFKDECYNPAQFVVHLPGSSLSSHFAVQAITRGFSVVTDTKTLNCGDLLHFTRSASTHISMSAKQRDYLIKCIETAIAVPLNSRGIAWAVSVIQGCAATKRTPETMGLLLAASVVIGLAGAAVVFGEHRHYYRIGPGKKGYPANAPVTPPFAVGNRLDKEYLERTQIYHAIKDLDWSNLQTWYQTIGYLHGVEADYRNPRWAGGYGGVKWAECTNATQEIFVKLLPFLAMNKTVWNVASTDTTYDYALNELIGAANKLITLSHNSAKCLTKLVVDKTLTMISEGKAGIYIATDPTTWELVK